ncbi:MAG: hypothetical protein JWM24_2103 [Solirubrobacterales bacterium]|nr:hypothetical protein [Solirubrobacterales bacterium]
MRRGAHAVLVALAIVLASLLLVGVAVADQASQLRPIDLRVFGGEGTWHPDNDFRLDWDRPPVAAQGFPIVAVDYRILNSAGTPVIPETRLPWDTSQIENLHLPTGPGIYTADVWLVGPGEQRGPQVSATLRFDDARPGPVQPLAPAGWVAGKAAAVVIIQHPAEPQPLSGIRGYAVSVDRGTGSVPCAGADRCSLPETDLRDGIDGDRASLGVLPEGVHMVRAVAVSGSGMRSAEVGSALVRVDATPPEVTLSGVPQGWANGPVRVAARATDSLSGMAPSGPGGPYTALAIDSAVPRVDPGDSTAAIVSGEGPHRLAFYARDAAGNVDDESPAVATVRVDESPPLIAFANSQDPREPERIEATVRDPLSGSEPTRGSIALRPAGSRQPFAPLPTVGSGGHLVARWNSDAFPAGTYEFKATGYDVAGNATSSDRRANGARFVLANPLKGQTEIAAGFGGRRLVWQRCSRTAEGRRCRREEIESFASRPALRAVPYGRGISYAGRLASASGSSLGSLPVEVVETFDSGANSSQRTTTVLTAADGTFVTHLQPGPSRRIEAVFAGNRTLTRANAGEVRLAVLGGVRMHASSTSARIGGAPVVFSGRVGDLGAPIPAAGRPVELQFRFAGSEWSEFRTVQTDAHGRFRYRYSFSDDDSRGIRFQFRAYAPEQDGWPYEPAFSRPVFVTGR